MYFFDDFLSALDGLVSKSVFSEVFLNYLSQKTRVFSCGKIGVIEKELERYIDNHLDQNHGAVTVIILKQGKIIKQGTWYDVKMSQEFIDYRMDE